MRHVGAPSESMALVEGLQELQQAVADGGQGAAADWDAAAREIGSDFRVPARLLVALRPGPGDQVVAETLALWGQVGELLQDEWRARAARALESDLPAFQRASGEHAGLLDAQFAAATGAVADGREEVDLGQALPCLQGLLPYQFLTH